MVYYDPLLSQIEPITPHDLPFSSDEKIFSGCHDECEENCCIHEKYSYNDWLDLIKSISGVSEDLIGKKKVKKCS